MALLPLLALVLLVLHFAAWLRGWRVGLLGALAVVGSLVWFFTEGLSALDAIAAGPLIALWAATCVALAVALFARRKRFRLPRFALEGLSWLEYVLLAGAAVIAATLLLIAWAAAPNNYDSMTYHLPRVMHWIQNGNVNFYPTSIDRQLNLDPLAEYVILHLQLLDGSDRYANLVQWVAMVASVLGVSLIAQQLGGAPRAQVYAALFCVTLPMGIMQATSTQNDYVAALWLVCATALTLRVMRSALPGVDWPSALLIGLSAGLGMATKATDRLFLAPILAWFGVWLARRLRWRAIAPLVVVAALIGVVNLPQNVRNFELYGRALMPKSRVGSYTNTAFTPGIFVSNALRNLVLQFALPRADWNRDYIVAPVRAIHAALGLDPDDPRSSYLRITLKVSDQWYFEDTAGNLPHTLLLFACVAMWASVGSLRRNRWLAIFGLALLAMYLLFVLVLKWQPWNSRLVLPIFVLASAFAGVTLAALPRWIGLAACAALLIYSVPWVTRNVLRPLRGDRSVLTYPRVSQYFVNSFVYEQGYYDAFNAIHPTPCRNVGLMLGVDTVEYPFWTLVRETRPRYRLEHVNVGEESAALAAPPKFANFEPCAVLAAGVPLPDTLNVNGREFAPTFRRGVVGLYQPPASGAPSR